jgi:hypothetical protein
MTFDDLDDLRMTFAALAFAGEGALRYGHPSVKKCPREPPVKKWPPPPPEVWCFARPRR